MGISFNYKEKADEEAHGVNAVAGSNDFSSKKELKQAVKTLFEKYQCPNCGGHRIEGNGVIVEIGKMKFFHEELKKGFFGSKHVEKHIKDVWRVHNIYLELSGMFSFLSPAGYIRCKSCKWESKGGKGVRWLSINDIRKGNF